MLFSSARQKIGAASMDWYCVSPTKGGGFVPRGVANRLSTSVLIAGICVKVASRTTAGRASSQPCTWTFSLRVRRAVIGRNRRRKPSLPPASPSLLIRRQGARGLGLRLVERGLRRLAVRQDRLQRVVQRLGDALVVVRRQFGDGVLELVARDQRRREVGDVFLHRRRLPGDGTCRDIAGRDAPVGGKFGRSQEAREFERRRLLGLVLGLEDIDVAAAG